MCWYSLLFLLLTYCRVAYFLNACNFPWSAHFNSNCLSFFCFLLESHSCTLHCSYSLRTYFCVSFVEASGLSKFLDQSLCESLAPYDLRHYMYLWHKFLRILFLSCFYSKFRADSFFASLHLIAGVYLFISNLFFPNTLTALWERYLHARLWIPSFNFVWTIDHICFCIII